MAKFIFILSTCLIGLAVAGATAQDVDPTRPLQYTPADRAGMVIAGAELKVQSIWFRESQARSVVAINGNLLHLGESINDYTITVIEPDRVRLQRADQHIWLYVFQPQGLLSRPSATHQENP